MKIISTVKTFKDLKIGDKVKIKNIEEIKKTLSFYDECNSVYFSPNMEIYCGKVLIVKDITEKGVHTNTDNYMWHFIKEWFEIL